MLSTLDVIISRINILIVLSNVKSVCKSQLSRQKPYRKKTHNKDTATTFKVVYIVDILSQTSLYVPFAGFFVSTSDANCIMSFHAYPAHSKKSFPLKKSPKSSKNPVTESHNPTVITPFAGFLSFFYETPNNFKIAGTAIIIKPPITFFIA